MPDGTWPLIFFGLFLVIWIASCIHFMLHWISPTPFDRKPLNRDQIPTSLLEREEAFCSQLKSLGFQSIGSCTSRWNNKAATLNSVWIRQDFIAEVIVAVAKSKRLSGVILALGQEFMDDTAISGITMQTNWLDINDESFYFPGLIEVAVLEEIVKAIIAKRRGNRLPWTPATALEYKIRDTKVWQDGVLKAKLYRFDSTKNRFRPRWKCLFRCAAVQTRNGRSFGLTSETVPKKTSRILKELGYPDLSTLIRQRRGAFPVVVDPAPAPAITDPASQPPPPQTSPSP